MHASPLLRRAIIASLLVLTGTAALADGDIYSRLAQMREKMMKTGRVDSPDVHARPLANRLEPLEHGDVLGTVGRGWLGSLDVLLQRHGRGLSSTVSEAVRAIRTCRSEAL